MKSEKLEKVIEIIPDFPTDTILSYSNDLFKSITHGFMQKLWVASHIVTLASFICFVILQFYKDNNFLNSFPWYPTCNYGAIVTYSLVLYRKYIVDMSCMDEDQAKLLQEKLQSDSVVLLSELLKSENAHLLIYACLWLYTPFSILKIVPFAIYSFLNVTNYFAFEVIPDHPFSLAITPLLAYLENPLLIISAHFDLAVIGELIHESKKSKSLYALIFYVFIWGLRVEHSDASRICVNNVLMVLDMFFLNEHIPSFISSYWIVLRKSFRKLLAIHDENISQVTTETKVKSMPIDENFESNILPTKLNRRHLSDTTEQDYEFKESLL